MRSHAGMTLVEILIGLAVTALLITVLLGVYTQGTGGYSHVQFQQVTERAAETALLEMGTALKNAMYAETKGTRLILTFPKDTDAYGHPIPVKQKEEPVYRAGVRYAYYLSDSTGMTTSPGTILWRGEADSSGNVTKKDSQWSLLPGSRQGRITPITRFVPTVTIEQDGIYVTLLVESVLTTHGEVYRARRQRTIAVGNANTWR